MQWLYEYWNDSPPIHEILAAVHGAHSGTSAAPVPRSSDNSAVLGQLYEMGCQPTKKELPLQKYSRWAKKPKEENAA